MLTIISSLFIVLHTNVNWFDFLKALHRNVNYFDFLKVSLLTKLLGKYIGALAKLKL